MNETAKSLIAYCSENGRVCPLPEKWNQLWEKLPNRARKGAGWEPPLPLILGAWNYSSGLEKMHRLSEHIEWVEKHGNLSEVEVFLRNLSENEWHHLGD